MDCYCDYGDGPSVMDEGPVKARKVHKCSECRGAILPGESYLRTWGIWEGEASVFKRCADCDALLKWALAHAKCLCWYYGQILSDVVEAAINDWDYECPGLADEAEAKVKAVREKRRALLSAQQPAM